MGTPLPYHIDSMNLLPRIERT